MVSLFSDRLSHRPGRGQSGVRLSVLRGSDQIWSRLHLVFWPPPPLCFAIEPQSRLHVHVPVCLDSSRGKGDYHRLGHGSDDHVRRPRQVQGLQGKKVIAIATGSLHCVCCTEDGRSLSHSQPPSLPVVAADVMRLSLLPSAQERCTRGATTTRASSATAPPTPSRGRGWWPRCRARRSTAWPAAPPTRWPGPPASPPTPGSCPRRCRLRSAPL